MRFFLALRDRLTRSASLSITFLRTRARFTDDATGPHAIGLANGPPLAALSQPVIVGQAVPMLDRIVAELRGRSWPFNPDRPGWGI